MQVLYIPSNPLVKNEIVQVQVQEQIYCLMVLCRGFAQLLLY